MEKKKLKLSEIKVESFITTLQGMGIEGGSYETSGGSGSGPTIGVNTCQASCNGTCNNTCAATCNYTNYATCTCPPATGAYSGCYC